MSPVAIFKLFFPLTVIQTICDHTNKYAVMHITEKPSSHTNPDGAWTATTPSEMYCFIALLIYMGFVQVPTVWRYWTTDILYHGLWARRFMTRKRFQALLAFLHVVDPETEAENDRLRKLRYMLDTFKQTCKSLFNAKCQVSIDERMVKSKGRSGMRQYIRDKPVKFGFKLWVLADPSTGYTIDFNVYTGRHEQASEYGLAYDVVMELVQSLHGSGYIIFMDNFYTSHRLLKQLKRRGLLACGTCLENRRGFPVVLKNGKQWGAKRGRGNMRWIRVDDVLYVQWKDNKVVTVATTAHEADGYVWVRRRVKEQGQWRQKIVKKPAAIDSYNKYMAGVDLSDQLIAKYNVLLKSMRWWKTLFFHLIDIAVVNSFIIFKLMMERFPDASQLQRPEQWSHLEFREELVAELIGIEKNEPVPLYTKLYKKPVDSDYSSSHMPVWSDRRLNCRVCYLRYGKEIKCSVQCSSDKCARKGHKLSFCFNKDRNCFKIWHSAAFNGHR